VTVGAALATATARLRERGDGARYDATLLLSATLHRDAAWLLAHADDSLPAADGERFAAAIERRAAGEPVPYVTGRAGFYGRLFAVDANVLVPRPETEGLVDAVLAFVRARGDTSPALCDVGTGSGAIAISLALELPTARVTALDISAPALAVARTHACDLGASERIRFVLGDGLGALAGERFACVAANLPYVRSADLAPAPDPTSFEPRLALDGGPDGLARYRDLLRAAPFALEPRGALVLEAGPDTAAALAREAARAFPHADVRIERDAAGLERLVLVTLA
jgi:release factor glutamine methyltransferase